ncbi:MAG TPA: hypothetical protein PKD86_05610 [Gemmatales bacterium]|nr:hypothetical protein [Gemmatales bacterium]HMP58810.1 hypothetical protein [Gemmatales bacterium]
MNAEIQPYIGLGQIHFGVERGRLRSVLGPYTSFHKGDADNLVDAYDEMGLHLLEPNGELLPVQHPIGTYYVYNCTTIVDSLDLEKSVYSTFDDGSILTIDRYNFIPEVVKDLSFFRIRFRLRALLCTQVVVDRVKQYGLQGFVFIKLWSLENGSTDYLSERRKAHREAEKLKPAEGPPLPVKGNAVVIRLYTEKKKAKKVVVAAAEKIMAELEQRLYEPSQTDAASDFGDIEGHDVVEHEIRIFLTTPDCHRLVELLLPYLKKLPWAGRYQVVKRFGEYVDEDAREEYARL